MRYIIEIFKYFGCKVLFENNIVVLDSSLIERFIILFEYVKFMCLSVFFMGVFLSKFRRVELFNYSGGCEIG